MPEQTIWTTFYVDNATVYISSKLDENCWSGDSSDFWELDKTIYSDHPTIDMCLFIDNEVPTQYHSKDKTIYLDRETIDLCLFI